MFNITDVWRCIVASIPLFTTPKFEQIDHRTGTASENNTSDKQNDGIVLKAASAGCNTITITEFPSNELVRNVNNRQI